MLKTYRWVNHLAWSNVTVGHGFAVSWPLPPATPRTSGLSLIGVLQQDLLSSMVMPSGCSDTDSRLCEA
jgi:hypothetical protein